LERQEAGSCYHATAEEGIPFRQIAEVIAQSLGLPAVALSQEEAVEHFGWLTAFVGKDMSASSTKTRELLKWEPTGPGLLADLAKINRSES
jgi:nucleoside-diphosphate-sugar epimerase